MKFKLALLLGAFPLFAGILSATPINAQSVLYDNTAASTSDADPVNLLGTLYDSFSVGDKPLILADVAFTLQGDNVNSTGTITVNLYADSSNTVGALLETLGTIPDSELPSAGALDVVNLSLTDTPWLDANTRYWVGLVSTDTSASWGYALDTTGTGVSGEFFQNVFGTFSNSDPGSAPYQMLVAGDFSITPEPATVTLAGAALAGLLIWRRRRLPRAS
jgi:PEP-CTERM motif